MSTAEMKAKLDQKVDRMRSQTMSFSNEGMEVSLSIPDTHDVKDTFGTVITTVVEQQDEIVGLHSNIRTVVEDSLAAQNKILDWTKKCVEQLHEQNLQLQEKLQDAQLQIKNFAYNIQGFVDPVAEPDFIEPEFNLVADAPQFQAASSPTKRPPEDPALFRTEDGASVGDVDSFNVQKTKPATTASPSKKDRSGPPRKTNEEKMAAKVMYFGVKPSLLPPGNRQRWEWAIKKVIAANRLRGLKLGMNKTRLAKNQTMMERMDRMDNDLFQLPITLGKLMKEQAEELTERLENEVSTIEKKLERMNEATEERNKQLDERLAGVDGAITAMGQKMDDLIESLAKKGKEDMQKIFDNLAVIEQHLTQVLGLDYTQFKTGIDDLRRQVKETSVKGEMLHVEVSAMIKASDEATSDAEVAKDPSKLLVEQLKQDILMRNSRANVALLESEFDMATGSHSAITKHIESYIAHYSKSNTANNGQYLPSGCMERLQELVQAASAVESFIVQGRSLVRGIKAELDAHDAQLSEKVNVLGHTFATVQGLKTVNENMIILRQEVGEIKQLADAANETMSQAQSAESERIEKALDKMDNRVTFVEESVNKLKEARPTTGRKVAVAAADALPAVVMDPAELASAMDTPLGDLEAKIAPMVMKIVEMSMGNFMMNNNRSRTPQQGMNRQNSVRSERGGGGERGERKRSKRPKDMGASFDSMGGASIPEGVEGGGGAVTRSLSRQPSAKAGIVLDESADENNNNGEPTATAAANRSRPQSALASGRRGSNANLDDLVVVGETANQSVRAGSASRSRGVSAKSNKSKTSSRRSRSARSNASEGVEHDITDEHGNKVVEMDDNLHGDGADGEEEDEYLYDEQDYENEFGDDVSQPGALNGSFADYNMGGSGNALLADMSHMRSETRALQKQLDDIAHHRITQAQAELLIRQILREERRMTNDKTPSALAQEDIDKHIREIIAELIQQKKAHDSEINALRAQFDQALVRALNVAMSEMVDDKKQSVITTKALCLGCGRPSLVSAHAERPPSPSFLPSIYANVSAGPDIHRGGFKMPVGGNSPPRETPKRRVFTLEQLSQQASRAGNLDNLPTSPSEELVGGTQIWHDLPQHSQSMVSDEGGAGGSHFDNFSPGNGHHLQQSRVGFDPLLIDDNVSTANNSQMIGSASMPMLMQGTTAPRRETSAMHSIRHAQGRPESEQLRPIYRKGFPGKKSAKAETTYAPERFDLPGTPQSVLKVSRITNVLKPQTAPHPSHGAGPLQGTKPLLSATAHVMPE